MNAHATGTVTVVGAGLAGLAAGVALSSAGFRVRILERRPYVGGRASSYLHPGAEQVVDNCQHILLGCCTNLRDLLDRSGAAEQIGWHQHFTYIEPGGRRSTLAPTAALPAPFHTTPAFLGMRAFGPADKLSIARGMAYFLRRLPPDSGHETFADWAARSGQTQRAVERFWRPVLVSALNDELDRISLHYAGVVIRDCFLRSPEAAYMGIPKVPLSELYTSVADRFRAQGGELTLRTSVDSLESTATGWCVHAGGQSLTTDAVVLALPFEAAAKLLPPGGSPLPEFQAFAHSPITSVHLWFDREVMDLPHAVLLDAPVDWVYHVSKLQPWRNDKGSYLDLVISSSKAQVKMMREQVLDQALAALPRYLPEIAHANLLKAAVTKEVRATFAVPPGINAMRPAQDASGHCGIYLAGDWTRTGWPATMEGAVRSGYLAAEAVSRAHGHEQKFVVPDLPATGLMRWLT